MAAHRLPAPQRRLAVLLGAGGAIVLRILFAAMAAMLLSVPFIQFGGGLILVWIAYKLLRDENAAEKGLAAGSSLFDAVKIIVLADVVMSLDNILAVGGASHGSLELLAFGLLLSMPIVIFGSGLLANPMGRLRWILNVGAFVLVWTAASMILEDTLVSTRFHGGDVAIIGLTAVLGLAVFGANQLQRRRRPAAAAKESASAEASDRESSTKPASD
jgi:YjbE family integral membrane protein